jgi:prevent-host-death family protein
MKFVTVRDFRGNSSRIWAELKQEHELIVTVNGKPAALLTPLSDLTMEESLRTMRRARAMSAVSAMQTRAVGKGLDTLSLAAINDEIHQVRAKRTR